MALVGDVVWVADRTGALRLYDFATGNPLRTTPGKRSMFVLCLLEVGVHVWAGFADGMVRVFDRNTLGVLKETREHAEGGGVQVMCHALRGRCVFTGSLDFLITMWDAVSCERMRILQGHRGAVRALQVHGNVLYSGGDDCSIKLWDLFSGSCCGNWEGHRGAVRALLGSGSQLWSASEDGTVRIWDIATPDTGSRGGCCVHRIQDPHTGPVTALLLVGSKVWSVCLATVFLWDLRTFELQGQFCAHTGYVTVSAVIHQSVCSRLWTCAADGELKVWNAESAWGGALHAATDQHAQETELQLEQSLAQCVAMRDRAGELGTELQRVRTQHAASVEAGRLLEKERNAALEKANTFHQELTLLGGLEQKSSEAFQKKENECKSLQQHLDRQQKELKRFQRGELVFSEHSTRCFLEQEEQRAMRLCWEDWNNGLLKKLCDDQKFHDAYVRSVEKVRQHLEDEKHMNKELHNVCETARCENTELLAKVADAEHSIVIMKGHKEECEGVRADLKNVEKQLEEKNVEATHFKHECEIFTIERHELTDAIRNLKNVLGEKQRLLDQQEATTSSFLKLKIEHGEQARLFDKTLKENEALRAENTTLQTKATDLQELTMTTKQEYDVEREMSHSKLMELKKDNCTLSDTKGVLQSRINNLIEENEEQRTCIEALMHTIDEDKKELIALNITKESQDEALSTVSKIAVQYVSEINSGRDSVSSRTFDETEEPSEEQTKTKEKKNNFGDIAIQRVTELVSSLYLRGNSGGHAQISLSRKNISSTSVSIPDDTNRMDPLHTKIDTMETDEHTLNEYGAPITVEAIKNEPSVFVTEQQQSILPNARIFTQGSIVPQSEIMCSYRFESIYDKPPTLVSQSHDGLKAIFKRERHFDESPMDTNRSEPSTSKLTHRTFRRVRKTNVTSLPDSKESPSLIISDPGSENTNISNVQLQENSSTNASIHASLLQIQNLQHLLCFGLKLCHAENNSLSTCIDAATQEGMNSLHHLTKALQEVLHPAATSSLPLQSIHSPSELQLHLSDSIDIPKQDLEDAEERLERLSAENQKLIRTLEQHRKEWREVSTQRGSESAYLAPQPKIVSELYKEIENLRAQCTSIESFLEGTMNGATRKLREAEARERQFCQQLEAARPRSVSTTEENRKLPSPSLVPTQIETLFSSPPDASQGVALPSGFDSVSFTGGKWEELLSQDTSYTLLRALLKDTALRTAHAREKATQAENDVLRTQLSLLEHSHVSSDVSSVCLNAAGRCRLVRNCMYDLTPHEESEENLPGSPEFISRDLGFTTPDEALSESMKKTNKIRSLATPSKMEWVSQPAAVPSLGGKTTHISTPLKSLHESDTHRVLPMLPEAQTSHVPTPNKRFATRRAPTRPDLTPSVLQQQLSELRKENQRLAQEIDTHRAAHDAQLAEHKQALEHSYEQRIQFVEEHKKEEVAALHNLVSQLEKDLTAQRVGSEATAQLVSRISRIERELQIERFKASPEVIGEVKITHGEPHHSKGNTAAQSTQSSNTKLLPANTAHIQTFYQNREAKYQTLLELNRELVSQQQVQLHQTSLEKTTKPSPAHARTALSSTMTETLTMVKKLRALVYYFETRPALLRSIYEIHQSLRMLPKSLHAFARVAGVRPLSRTEALSQIQEFQTQVEGIRQGSCWVLGNLFTSYELQHIGASPAVFQPQGLRPTWRDITLPERVSRMVHQSVLPIAQSASQAHISARSERSVSTQSVRSRSHSSARR